MYRGTVRQSVSRQRLGKICVLRYKLHLLQSCYVSLLEDTVYNSDLTKRQMTEESQITNWR